MWETLFADNQGKIYDAPGWGAVGRLGDRFVEPVSEEMIPLPDGATLTMIPQRHPVVMDMDTGAFQKLPNNIIDEGEAVYAVGALLPQGYTRTLVPAFTGDKGSKELPLLGYTLCGIKDDQIYVAAQKTDKDCHWNSVNYNTANLEHLVAKKKQDYPSNRIIQQLSMCSLRYGCFTAQNMFYQRWEAGIPVSPVCNAACIGCISKQPAECCPSPQQRIDFVPHVKEITELAVEHLANGADAIVSFGQGCEGEPSLQAELISNAITAIRKTTNRGTINMNTNGGYTEGIKKICEAGIDSLRVSLNSAILSSYHCYYRPHNYSFADVVNSLKVAQQYGVFVSLNLLAFPGVNDREEEIESLIALVKENGVQMIQLRNLNIDPDTYLAQLPAASTEPLGVPALLEILREQLPHVAIGNYSRNIADI